MDLMTDQAFFEKYLKAFTPAQLEAVRAVDGPVLLLAVPGSGKTTVLVARLGYMTLCRGIAPESILTVTYTVAATRQMHQRFAKLFGQELADLIEFRTINGISAKIISYYERRHGRGSPFRLLDSESDLNRLVARIYCQVTGERYAPQSTVKDIRTGITYVKNMMLSADEISGVDTGVESFPEIYMQYCDALKSRRLMDYDDQMTYALLFLEKVPSLLEYFQNRFSYICVDEAQDTSKVQHEIIKLLSSRSGNLFMVGDEDQSIYGFRAAYPDALMRFESDHPGARILLIEDNFRSTPEIVALANTFVTKNRFRRDKTIRPTKMRGDAVWKIRAVDREAQYDYLFHSSRAATGETAILYRNNDSALPLIDLFERNRVPYNCRNFDSTFFSHRIINDIRAIVRFAQDPTDAEAFMQIYYKFSFPLSRVSAESACERSKRSGKGILNELLTLHNLSGPVRDGIRDILPVLPSIPGAPADRALSIILNDLQYKQYVEKNHLDSGKFFVLHMLSRYVSNIDALLRRLDELRELIQNHENIPNTPLTLSTIHSAKGLEFERVFLLDILDGILPSKPAEACKTDGDIQMYEEDRRLFYVAMTRAKSSLHLFSCTASPSSFIDEAIRALPQEAAPENDVFSFLYDNLLGKTYESREKGRGKLLAQCVDNFLIKYSGGETQLLSLSQMVEGRDTTIRYAPPKPVTVQKTAKPTETANKSIQQFKAGKRVLHTLFGSGRIIAVTSSGSNAIVTVTFDKTKDIKRFMLSVALEKGLLKLLN